ncbi:MazG family protein [Cellulomonas flavigena DSM 20109]|uniref:MazG family protein n=1 Tax=Cellulomonas flavigena (strain ATCC 482 / DSM 20109 / BCRC 11376 / JCM 18109 / NBRC 3775 / NCIMB 8073 / NRS 134) TaxID=446466 RepID=D5UK69_CELFN|nr:MazG family protein [Cellulomonas flavigena DSM 20109]
MTGAPGPHDRQAAALARVVAVMDRLRSPEGCPWYAEQTHTSLLPYALEEAHELVEAVEHGDPAHVREELGDLLLQVLVHARIASEDPVAPFDVGDVADDLAAKLVRRNPHVFGPGAGQVLDAATVDARWQDLKRAEKPARTSVLDGVPASMGALARAQKLVARAGRAGLLDTAPVPAGPSSDGPVPADAAPAAIGEALLALVVAAQHAGVDAEAALRRATADWEAAARRAEA